MQTVSEKIDIATYCVWRNAVEKASESGVPFHPEWSDFNAFYRDMGKAPDKALLRRVKPIRGYVPGNVTWQGKAPPRPTFTDCSVATDLMNAGLLSADHATRLAYLDVDPFKVRTEIAEINSRIKGKTAGFQREAYTSYVEAIEHDHQPVPYGEPTRWEIETICAQLRDIRFAARGLVEEDRGEDPIEDDWD